MQKGTIVERTYQISNMKKYLDANFLNQLDEITAKNGCTILERSYIENNANLVRLKVRFDSDHWDICQALDFLSKHGISVSPVSDFTIIAGNNEIKISCEKGKQIAENALEQADAV